MFVVKLMYEWHYANSFLPIQIFYISPKIKAIKSTENHITIFMFVYGINCFTTS